MRNNNGNERKQKRKEYCKKYLCIFVKAKAKKKFFLLLSSTASLTHSLSRTTKNVYSTQRCHKKKGEKNGIEPTPKNEQQQQQRMKKIQRQMKRCVYNLTRCCYALFCFSFMSTDVFIFLYVLFLQCGCCISFFFSFLAIGHWQKIGNFPHQISLLQRTTTKTAS